MANNPFVNYADSIKALPSTPIWTSLNMSFSTFYDNRVKLWSMTALYQKTDSVHAPIDLTAKALCAGHPMVCQKVTKGSKTLSKRNLKKLNNIRYKNLMKQWYDKDLNRKTIDDDEEIVEATDNDFIKALNNKDEANMELPELIRCTAVMLEIYGIAFWQKVRDVSGNVINYLFMPTYSMVPVRSGNNTILNWLYSPLWGSKQDEREIELDDIIIFRYPSMGDPTAGGDSPLMSAMRKVEIESKFLEWQEWILNNKARPDYLYIPKLQEGETLSPEQINRAKKRIQDQTRGQQNGGVAIGEYAGQLEPLNWSPIDLAPIEFSKEAQRGILAALHVPDAMFTAQANRATALAAQEQFARYAVAPLVVLIERVLTEEAKTFDSNLCFVFENVIPADADHDLEVERHGLELWKTALASNAATINEFREQVLNLPPMEEAMVPPPKEESEIVPEVQERVEDEESEDNEEKNFDLINLNIKVSEGVIDRATAINIASKYLKINQDEAKLLITKKKKSEIINKTSEPEQPEPKKINETINFDEIKINREHEIPLVAGADVAEEQEKVKIPDDIIKQPYEEMNKD